MKQLQDRECTSQHLSVGAVVLPLHYTQPSFKWKSATVVDKSSPRSCEVQVDDSKILWPRHADQLLSHNRPTIVTPYLQTKLHHRWNLNQVLQFPVLLNHRSPTKQNCRGVKQRSPEQLETLVFKIHRARNQFHHHVDPAELVDHQRDWLNKYNFFYKYN